MGERKYVHLMFITGGMILAYVLVQSTDWVWGYFQKPDPLRVFLVGVFVAAAITFALWRNPRTFSVASETVGELRKVTWPTRKETSQATVVVIILVIICAFFLGMFDFFWSWATNLLLA